MKSKQLSLVLGSAILAGSSLSAQNLIINGDFEVGLSGANYGSYASEGNVTFSAPIGSDPVVNNSNWVIGGDSYQTVRFRNLVTPSDGWAVRLGNYTSQTLTNTDTLTSLSSGSYEFSFDIWGDANETLGSQVSFTLIGVGSNAGTDQLIGIFEDTVDGSIQNISTEFTLDASGDYQIQIAQAVDNEPGNPTENAWVDNISLSAVPEPSSYALMAGLAGLSLAVYRRRRQVV